MTQLPLILAVDYARASIADWFRLGLAWLSVAAAFSLLFVIALGVL